MGKQRKRAEIPDFEVPEVQCPGCGTGLNGTSPIDAKTDGPMEGDWTVCCYCGEFLAFTSGLGIRTLTEEEQREAAHDRIMQEARRAIREWHARKN